MEPIILVLSGPIGCGKSALTQGLADEFGFSVLKTQDVVRRSQGASLERVALQKAGEDLDRTTRGTWVVEALHRLIKELADRKAFIVDACRTEDQIAGLRTAFPSRVIHVHLTAPRSVLERRWLERRGRLTEPGSYDDVKTDPTEANIESLATVADVVLDTHQHAKADVVARVAAHLRLYGRGVERLVDVVIGGQYGSEGKGHVSWYLSSEYALLVRVGGPNAGHTVAEPNGTYTFHHLPSGTRRTSASILIGAGAVLGLPTLLREIKDCNVTAARLSIDPHAMIIEEADIAWEKSKLEGSIGSTAQGVGAASARRLLRGGHDVPVRLAKDVAEIRPFVDDTVRRLEKAYSNGDRVLLEGTQGTGLSLHHGRYPYVTSRDTTVAGCLSEAGIPAGRVRKVVMVCRTYPIRVQDPPDATSGPMTNEIDWDIVAARSGNNADELRAAEKTSTTGRKRRVCEFDWALLRRAATLNAATDIALTFADYISIRNRDARRYEQLTPETINLIGEVERVSSCPVTLIGTRFHNERSIIDRRHW